MSDDDALFRTILLPTLAAVAERSGGFDWKDDAFETAYGRSSTRCSAAPAPTRRSRRCRPLGRTAADLGGDIRIRPLVAGELSGLWPEALGLMPAEFGRDVDRLCVLELARELDAEGRAARRRRRARRRRQALRLATAGAIAAGPVVFERLDFRPLRISPLLPIAATQPPRRADPARFAPGPRRRRPSRAAAARRRRPPARRGARPLGALALRGRAVPDGPGARRAYRSARLGRRPLGLPLCARPSCSRRRRRPAQSSRTCCTRRAGSRARDGVRRALVEALLAWEPPELVGALDETLLGLQARGRPPSSRPPDAGHLQSARRFHEVVSDTSHLRRYRRRYGRSAAGGSGSAGGSGQQEQGDPARQVDEARQVLERLERIRELDREERTGGAPARGAKGVGRRGGALDEGGGRRTVTGSHARAGRRDGGEGGGERRSSSRLRDSRA